MCLLQVLLSAPHMCVPTHTCPYAACGNAGVTLLVWNQDDCVHVCLYLVCVCLSVAQLWNLLILTSEAASISLPAPPPVSTWKTDRQADRQLSSQLVKLCLP